MVIIYSLEKNNIPFYVGKCTNINTRFSQHKKTFGNGINIKVLELVEVKDWKLKEKYYIELFKSNGYELKNKNNGGGGPTNLNSSSKKKITDSKLGNNYKLKNIPDGKIEELYETKSIYQICKELTLTFNTVKKYLEEKKLYTKNKNRSLDSKQTKMRKSLANKGKRSRPVEQYDLNDTLINKFKNMTEACLYIDKPNRQGDITSCCQGKQSTAFGYKWKYKDKYKIK